MYLPKVIPGVCRKTFFKISFWLASWRSLLKIAGSGSISQRHGSADPDPHQHVMDPQHWFWLTNKHSRTILFKSLNIFKCFQQPSQVVPRGWPYNWQPSVPVTPPGKRRFFSHRWFFRAFSALVGTRGFLLFVHFLHCSGLADFFAFLRTFCISRDSRIFCCTAFGDFSCACMGKIGLAIPEMLRRLKWFFLLLWFPFVKTFQYKRNDPSPNGQLVLLSNFVLS